MLSLALGCIVSTTAFADFDVANGSHSVQVSGSIQGIHATLNPLPPLAFNLSLSTTSPLHDDVGDQNFPWQDWSWAEGSVADAKSKAETAVKSSTLAFKPGDSRGHAGANGNSAAETTGAATVNLVWGINAPDMWLRPQSHGSNGSRSITDILTHTITLELSQFTPVDRNRSTMHPQWRARLSIGNTTYAPIYAPYSNSPSWGSSINIRVGNVSAGSLCHHQAYADLHTKFNPSIWSIMAETTTTI